MRDPATRSISVDDVSVPSDLDGAGRVAPLQAGTPCGIPASEPKKPLGIHMAQMPGGRTMRLARVMQTTACSLSCRYCATRCGRPVKRTTFKPDDLAATFFAMHRRRRADGLFLTSGIPGKAVRVMDLILATAEILRLKLGYKGYLHLKILPGCTPDQIERASQLASRVSLNLEAPSQEALRSIAPEKDFGENLFRLEYAGRYRLSTLSEDGRTSAAPSGITTQFVVGASTDRDREILGIVNRLYRDRLLHHAHFSPFEPVMETPLEEHRPTPPMRGHRLYQADHLMREYGFKFDELIFDDQGNLPLLWDPKLSWALKNPQRFPIEAMTASREELLRVPGIGPLTADRIMRLRSREIWRDPQELAKAGVIIKRAGGFVAFRGRLLRGPKMASSKSLSHERQMEWWPAAPERRLLRSGAVSPGAFR